MDVAFSALDSEMAESPLRVLPVAEICWTDWEAANCVDNFS